MRRLDDLSDDAAVGVGVAVAKRPVVAAAVTRAGGSDEDAVRNDDQIKDNNRDRTSAC